MRCIYASNATTNSRQDKCGKYGNVDQSRPCAEQGIDNLQKWQANYQQMGAVKQCSLGVDKAAFALSMQATNSVLSTNRSSWNEAILAIWSQNIPIQLPLEAIFYTEGGVAGAQYVQRDYFQQTYRFLPILKLKMGLGQASPFSYFFSDQISSG